MSRETRIFFPEYNIRLYDKNSESEIIFFLHQNQNIFFSNTGNQNIFLEKYHNPEYRLGEVDSIQHYVIKFVSGLRQGLTVVFRPGPPVSFTNKTDPHDVTEILLKMALSTWIIIL